MAKLTAAERDALPDSAFAYIDSKGNRFLPIHDAIHVRDAMSRWSQTDFESPTKKATARSKILAAAKKFGIDVSNFANPLSDIFDNLAKKVSGKAEMSNVTLEANFAVESEEEDGDDLVLSGRLFKAGEYTDQNFSLTPLEFHGILERFFGPVQMDLHHKGSKFEKRDFSGQLGQVEDIWTDDSGEWLMAKARKPKWLHSLVPETRVSATFSREPKSLVATAWTHDPVVTDAQLIAAFAKHTTPSGQSTIQAAHDALARGGAVCNKPAAMASRKESNTIQAAHDELVKGGAQCESVQPGQSMPTANYAKPTTTRSKRMNMKEFLLGKAKEDGIELDEADIEAAFSNDPDPAVAEMQAKLKAAEDRAAALEAAQTQHAANFARMEAESRETAAVNFANAQIAAKHIVPASAEALKALAAAVSKSDATASFAEGEKSQTVLLQEFIDSLPDLSVFTTNMVKDAQFAVLTGTEKTPGVNGEAEARDEILKKMRNATPAGRQIEKEKQNGNHA